MSTDPYSPRVTVCRSEGSDPSELFGRNLAAFVAAQCQWARQLSRSESTTPDSPQVRSRRLCWRSTLQIDALALFSGKGVYQDLSD